MVTANQSFTVNFALAKERTLVRAMPLKGAPAVGRTDEGDVDPACGNGERTRALKVVYPRNPNEGIGLRAGCPNR